MNIELNDDATDALARHVIAHCLEGEINDRTPDDVEWGWRGWSIEDVQADGSVIHVEATQSGSQAERVARKTHHHPAEYKHYEGTIYLVARADWSDDHLIGECDVTIEFEGGAPSPPSPNVEERRYDL